MNSEKSSCLLLLFLDISNDVYNDCICVYMYVTHMHYLAIVLLPLYMYTRVKANIHVESPEQNTAFCSLCLHKCSLLIKSLRGIAVCEKNFLAGFPRVPRKKVVRLERLLRCIETELALITHRV